MKKKSVIYKLLITFSSITTAVLILVGIFLSILINKEYVNQKYNFINDYIEIIDKSAEDFINNNDDAAYKNLLNIMQIMKLSVKVDSIIIDSQGYVYAVSDEDLSNIKYTKIEISDSDFDLLKNNTVVEKEYIDNSDEKVKAQYIPLLGKSSFNGVIILLVNEGSEYFYKLFMIIWVSILLAVILSNIVAYYFAQRILINPLSEINNAAKKLAKGEVEKRVYIESDDEVGELANSFNIMAESLEKVELARREFISNVSHELRSPLTSIKGFITGIIDGVIPRDRESYYLNIVNNEVSRLSRLVTDLLDISAMESGKFRMNIVKVDINEIITLCILNLEAKVKEKNINVEVIFSEDHQYCFADRDRIMQVIINLMENAIKYGDEGGKIQINTYAKSDIAYVSIFNTGVNISKEDINKIWERFYKIDKSRTNKISTGLGLPIVRLILTQHNQDVWSENIPGKGVKFTFTLKRASK